MLGSLTWAAEWYDPKGSMTPDDLADELMKMVTLASQSNEPSPFKWGGARVLRGRRGHKPHQVCCF